ncbi:hypothetical protein K490DRAFT_66046 [Saccharata proteae CBS 121410]|uniref:Rhodopsin domain-containing protein n=1 Tax=Saccharata proteae CBS 121410 TaxID=1314787 RepID=A0A9P4LV61_9PEZI|nr:hypothetical protein K490DRAFT_66046 [Saccharata proteae CBS 121410]
MRSSETYNWRLTIGVATTLLILVYLSYILRLWARSRSAARLWWDDYWMGFVLLLCTAMSVGDYVGLLFGSGQHQDELDAYTVRHFKINLYVYMCTWSAGVFGVKVGILLFYWRIFSTTSRAFRVSCFVVSGFCFVQFIINIFVFIFQCSPIGQFWGETANGICINQVSFYLASAIINVFGDLFVLSLPIPVIWRLHAAKSRRVALLFVFLLGALVCVASGFRILSVTLIEEADFTYSNLAGGIWSTVEVHTGYITANLPTIRSLLRMKFGKNQTAASSSYQRGNSKAQQPNNAIGTGGTRGRWKGASAAATDLGSDTVALTTVEWADPASSGASGISDSGEPLPINGINVRTVVDQVEEQWAPADDRESKTMSYQVPRF